METTGDSLEATLSAVLLKYRSDPTCVVQILRDVQQAARWIPPRAISAIAAAVGLPRARVEGVAGFYSFLHLRPAGEYRIVFSDNITDRMLGSVELCDRLCNRLWLERGKVSEDGLVSVDRTSCTGMCDQGPAALVNGRAVTSLSAERVDRIAELVRSRTPLAVWPAEYFEVRDNVRRADVLLGGQWVAGDGIRAAVSRGAEETLAELKRSNLRGRGGAGFQAAVKWAACRSAPGPQRYIVCNADEGEPGTFKDRVLLASHADLVVEGMTVAAFTIGASRGFIYLRGEYAYLLPALHATLERRRGEGLLGQAIAGVPGFDFDIDVHVGAGAYVCGEETALLESLEGKRGVPRIRPPFPVTHGYLGRPTVVNNVETLANAAMIAQKGGEWFAGIGTSRSAGTKILSVSGDVEWPGIYEYPFGVEVAQLLHDCGAGNAQAVQVGGASGSCLAMHEYQRRIAFEDVPSAGAFMVFGPHRDMFDVALNFARFFAHESCGFCTPCRVGTTLVKNCMNKIQKGHGTQHEINEIFRIRRLLQTASHCGLGQTACNAVAETAQKFRPAWERRLASLDYEPAFDLDAALATARQVTGRDDAAAHLGTAHGAGA